MSALLQSPNQQKRVAEKNSDFEFGRRRRPTLTLSVRGRQLLTSKVYPCTEIIEYL